MGMGRRAEGEGARRGDGVWTGKCSLGTPKGAGRDGGLVAGGAWGLI